jgi:hypothetical protein
MVTMSISADTPARTTRELGRLSLIAAGAFLGVYGFMVLTPFGQTLDDSIYLGRVDAVHRTWAKALLNSITIASVAVVLAVAFGIALLRRRPLAGLVAVGATGVAIVTAEILKMVVPRPDLTPLDDQIGTYNTLPSGHATLATGCALALVVVASTRWRPWVALAGAAFAGAVAPATVFAGWHRPSDALAGVVLAAATSAAGCAILVARRSATRGSAPGNRWFLPGYGALCGVAVVAMVSLGGDPVGAASTVPMWFFELACAVLAIWAASFVIWVVWVLRRTDLGAAD